MLKKEFIEMMKNDEELQELRKKIYAITGNLNDICFRCGHGCSQTLEEWKESLREKLEKETKS